MSAFVSLRNVCIKFEEELQRASTELFSAKIEESFEDGIAKKMQDLSLFTSKVRFLRAKPISLLPQVTEQEKDRATVLNEYQDMVTWKIIDGQAVKSVAQATAVKKLITTKNEDLDPEMVERKEKIIKLLTEYENEAIILQDSVALLRERETQLKQVRDRWDELLEQLKAAKAGSDTVEEIDLEHLDIESPLYKKLGTLVHKLELMRWLTSKLATSRGCGYDWQRDPHRRLAALKAARAPRSVEALLEE